MEQDLLEVLNSRAEHYEERAEELQSELNEVLCPSYRQTSIDDIHSALAEWENIKGNAEMLQSNYFDLLNNVEAVDTEYDDEDYLELQSRLEELEEQIDNIIRGNEG